MSRSFFVLSLFATLSFACSGVQSALDPAGREAARIAELFFWMAAAAVLIWILVVGLTIYAIRVERGPHSLERSRLLVAGGGFVFPSVALAGLLSYSLISSRPLPREACESA
jgi:cytochrome c oxidase subunit 2